MRIVRTFILVRLGIGAIAAGRRGRDSGSPTTCAEVETDAVSIAEGPLKEVGVNP